MKNRCVCCENPGQILKLYMHSEHVQAKATAQGDFIFEAIKCDDFVLNMACESGSNVMRGSPGGIVGSTTDKHRLRAASSLPLSSRTHSTDRVVTCQRLAAVSSMFRRGQPGWSGLFDGSAMHSHT